MTPPETPYIPEVPENTKNNESPTSQSSKDKKNNQEVLEDENVVKQEIITDIQDYESVEYFLPKYAGNHGLVATTLIEVGKGWKVADNLQKFQGLNHADIALKLIEKGEGGYVASNLEKFQGLNHSDIALKLIEKGKGESVAYYLQKFQGLNHADIALKLIKKGEGGYVASNLQKFQGLNHADIALKLIEEGKGSKVIDNLEKFQILNHSDIALKLIEKGKGGSIADNLQKFQGLNHSDIALKLIERSEGWSVISNLQKFQGLDHSDIVLKLIEKGKGWDVVNNFGKFQGLNSEVAFKLIERGDEWYVISNFEKFQGLNPADIALKLIEEGKGSKVIDNLEKFQILNHSDIALKLIEKGKGESVARNLEKFQGLNHSDIALKLIEKDEEELVIDNLEKFQILNHSDIALKLIEKDKGWRVVRNLEKFKGLDHSDIASKLISYFLAVGNIEEIDRIEKKFSIDPDHIRLLISNLVDQGNSTIPLIYNAAKSSSIFSAKEMNHYYHQAIEHNITGSKDNQENIDPQLKQNYELLIELLGAEKVKKLLLTNKDFWINPHDSLLFVERIIKLNSEQQQNITKLVLSPLLNSQSNLTELNNLLGSFDVDIYCHRFSEAAPQFANWQSFEREVLLQKNNIAIPDNASESFKEAIKTLIQAPGVDVRFLRELIDYNNTELTGTHNQTEATVTADEESQAHNHEHTYEDDIEDENDNNYYEDEYEDDDDDQEREDFKSKLISVIEHPEVINSKQMIKSFEATIPFDPLNRLVFTAVGIHALNTFTPKLVEHFTDNKNLQAIVRQLEEVNKQKEKNITDRYNEKITDNPDRKIRLLADMQKEITSHQILSYNKTGTDITGIHIENRQQYKQELDTASLDEIKMSIRQAILNSPELKVIVADLLYTLAERQSSIGECVDLIPFEHIIPLIQPLHAKLTDTIEVTTITLLAEGHPEKTVKRLAKQTVLQELPVDEIMNTFEEQELLLAEALIYFGYNNRSRQTQSKDLKNTLDRVFKQEKYKKQEKDPFLAYIKGNLSIESSDEEIVRSILEQYGYSDIGRNLKIEIAEKSDPRGWVCGDYTDCCMPFTSSKNQEYLLREDMAYFLVSIVDKDGSEDIVAQSVLVKAKDEKNFPIVAIDNIEIANRALKYRPIICEGYNKLKEELRDRFSSPDQPFKVVIGTSYNDDGGIVTANCPLETTTGQPELGDMRYSDWLHHSSNYVLYDSEKKDTEYKYFGLQIDLLERSKLRAFDLSKENSDEVRKLLERIGQGQDDGDNGLNFPDNYSVVIERDNQPTAYIIAADYLTEDNENDYIIFEKIHFSKEEDTTKKHDMLNEYLRSRNFHYNDDVDGIFFRSECVNDNPDIVEVIKSYFSKDKVVKETDGFRVVFNKKIK